MSRRVAGNKLLVRWCGREKDLRFFYPNQWDGALANMIMCGQRWESNGKLRPSFVEELEKRGYDIKTLRFSVEKKAPGG